MDFKLLQLIHTSGHVNLPNKNVKGAHSQGSERTKGCMYFMILCLQLDV